MRAVVLLLTFAVSLASLSARASGPDMQELIAGLNEVRLEAGLSPLEPDPTLTRLSSDYAQVMADTDCMAHDCGGQGKASDRARSQGYSFLLIGEALAGGPPDAAGALALWMGSPLHRDILLNPDLSEVGVGYAHREVDLGKAPYGHYWVVTVGLPQ